MKRGFLSLIVFLILTVSVSFAQTSSENVTYKNAGLGIEMTGPASWFMSPEEEIKEMGKKALARSLSDLENLKGLNKRNKSDMAEVVKATGPLVAFYKYSRDAKKDFNPSIVLIAEDLKPEYHFTNSLDYAKAGLNDLTTLYKGILVVKKPAEVIINGRKFAQYITEQKAGIVSFNRISEVLITIASYTYVAGDTGYTLSLRDKSENFDVDVRALDECIKTLTFK